MWINSQLWCGRVTWREFTSNIESIRFEEHYAAVFFLCVFIRCQCRVRVKPWASSRHILRLHQDALILLQWNRISCFVSRLFFHCILKVKKELFPLLRILKLNLELNHICLSRIFQHSVHVWLKKKSLFFASCKGFEWIHFARIENPSAFHAIALHFGVL